MPPKLHKENAIKDEIPKGGLKKRDVKNASKL